MLSGIRDEVVPAEHMQGLWEIVKRRDAGAPAGTSTRKLSFASKPSSANDDNRSGLTTKESQHSGVNAQVEDTRTLSKFVEFRNGTHSA